MCQTVVVDNATGRPFRNERYPTSHTAESAEARQAFRRRVGHEFVNGWYVLRAPEWTEYQRYYELEAVNGRISAKGTL